MTSHSEHRQPKVIDFEECLEFLENAGQKQFNARFRIHQEDHSIIYKLLVYIYRDQRNAAKIGIDLRKSILLTGPVGCGKTSLMTLLRLLLPQKHQYIMKSSRDITLEFFKDGYAIINRYSRGSYYTGNGQMRPKVYCFDDLGVESNIKYYGNDTNVMAEILLSRYDLFVNRGMLTHATSNLNAQELEQIYGNRVRSRMREMFNVISFSKDSKDKRV
ncbi:MAG: AAA domain-containing protein [Bacteroidetes bacterium]|jgi:DNA replication protein DnaC|nr:AAA domain-containing protein [Bacteroidota bacterium]